MFKVKKVLVFLHLDDIGTFLNNSRGADRTRLPFSLNSEQFECYSSHKKVVLLINFTYCFRGAGLKNALRVYFTQRAQSYDFICATTLQNSDHPFACKN